MLDVTNSLRLFFEILKSVTLGGRYLAQKKGLQNPSRIQQAEDRLESAVARLEVAIQGASAGVLDSNERIV